MEPLRKQVRSAQWRLALRRFFGVLGWCWFGALMVALALITIDKYVPLHVAPWGWAAGALAVGLLAAAFWTFATRPAGLSAAIEIDRRYGLKERVSSTLAMPPEERQSEVGQALLQDAVRRVERIDLAEKFSVAAPRQILLPIVPGLLALLVALFVTPAGVDNPATASAETAHVQQQIKKSTEALNRKLTERREQAKKQGLEEAERLFKKLEDGTKNLAADPPERKKALVELNDLTRELQNRRRELDGADRIKQQLEQLKNLARGPADKFAQAAAKGDFQQAAKELEKLKEQLAGGKLDQQQKQELAKQLDQMKEKLEKLAEANRAAQADLKKRADQLRAAGQPDDAAKLEEQIAKLKQQAPQMQQLDGLAKQLGQCAQCLKDGKPQDAENALKQLQAGMDNLQQKLDEMKMLDDAMAQLGQAKEQMNCPFCGGEGCEQCQGIEGKPGPGLGRGRGNGERPEAKTDTASYDSAVKQKVGQGAADVVDMVDGPNVKGNVEQDIQQQFDSARQGATDPLSGRNMPRKHRQNAQEYFDRFREGK